MIHFHKNQVPIPTNQNIQMYEDCVIIDNGSDTIKSGICGENEPRSFMNPCTILQTVTKKDKRFENPFSKGNIVDWDNLEKVWRYILYQDLRVTPEERPIFMAVAPLTPTKNKEKLTGILFESFGFPALYLGNQASLALSQSGKLTGMSVTSGHSQTYISPVYEGYALAHATIKFDRSGSDLTDYFMKTFKLDDEEVAREIKEKYSMIDDVDKKIPSEEFELPDGSKISIGKERLKGPEMFFNSPLSSFTPDITSVDDFGGVQTAIYTSIQRMDSSLSEMMYRNVILSGGTCLIKGYKERLEEELQGIADDESWPCCTQLLDDDIYATWLGANQLAGLGSFSRAWVTKQEYEEIGPQVIQRKCF